MVAAIQRHVLERRREAERNDDKSLRPEPTSKRRQQENEANRAAIKRQQDIRAAEAKLAELRELRRRVVDLMAREKAAAEEAAKQNAPEAADAAAQRAAADAAEPQDGANGKAADDARPPDEPDAMDTT